jgi:hypothetical protein
MFVGKYSKYRISCYKLEQTYCYKLQPSQCNEVYFIFRQKVEVNNQEDETIAHNKGIRCNYFLTGRGLQPTPPNVAIVGLENRLFIKLKISWFDS